MTEERKERLLAVHNAKGKYVKGIVLLEGQEPEDVGEEIPKGCTVTEVDEFPMPKQDARLERITKLRTSPREEFAELIMEDVQKWMLNTLRELGVDVTKEQANRLFPLARDE